MKLRESISDTFHIHINDENKGLDFIRKFLIKDTVSLDSSSTKRAGYPVFRADTNPDEYICDLGTRYEVNLKDGTTVNIWIDD